MRESTSTGWKRPALVQLVFGDDLSAGAAACEIPADHPSQLERPRRFLRVRCVWAPTAQEARIVRASICAWHAQFRGEELDESDTSPELAAALERAGWGHTTHVIEADVEILIDGTLVLRPLAVGPVRGAS